MLLSAYSSPKFFRPVGIDDPFTGLERKARKWIAELDFGLVWHTTRTVELPQIQWPADE